MPRYSVTSLNVRALVDSQRTTSVISELTEAEVAICEWALNEVSCGRLLCSRSGGFTNPRFSFYDGPTDGVAP